MDWLIADWQRIGVVAVVTLLAYVIAFVLLRVSPRRTLAEFSPYDFVVAVSVGAIVAQTAVSPSVPALVGIIALVTLVTAHRVVGWLRRVAVGHTDAFRREALVIVADGAFRYQEMRKADLLDREVVSELRHRGVRRLSDIRWVLLEPDGALTVVEVGSELSHDLAHGVRWPAETQAPTAPSNH